MQISKVDVLAIGVHPDDVELGCGGSILKFIKQGHSVGICDLTAGELGTRGSAEIRIQEAEAAREILGAAFRVNLGLPDGFIQGDQKTLMAIIKVIRACQPRVVLCNALEDRHPDHGRSAQIEKDACFLSGLRRIETEYNGANQEAWRPELVLHYIQDRYLKPSIIFDITEEWDDKIKAVKAFSSQFYNPNSQEPESSISGKQFLENVEARALDYGRLISAGYGEGFISERPLGITELTSLQ